MVYREDMADLYYEKKCYNLEKELRILRQDYARAIKTLLYCKKVISKLKTN